MFLRALLASKDMNGKQYSAAGVLPNPFHTQMSLCQLLVANCSLASTSDTRFATVAAWHRSGLSLSQNVDPFPCAPGQKIQEG